MNHLKPNIARAHNAERTLARHSLHDDLHTGLVDLLTDAMHWCDFTSNDFHFAFVQACRHYFHELNDEQQDERRIIP